MPGSRRGDNDTAQVMRAATRLLALDDPLDRAGTTVDVARDLFRADLAFLVRGVRDTSNPFGFTLLSASGAGSEALWEDEAASPFIASVLAESRPARTDLAQTTAENTLRSEGVRELMAAPIMLGADDRGTIVVCSRASVGYAAADVALLGDMAALAGSALAAAASTQTLRDAIRAADARTADAAVVRTREMQLRRLLADGADPIAVVDAIGTWVGGTVDLIPAGEGKPSLSAGRVVEVVGRGRSLGFLTLPDIDEAVFDVIVEAALPVLAAALLLRDASIVSTEYAQDALLVELLTTSDADPDDQLARAHLAGLSTEVRYMVVVVEPKRNSESPRLRRELDRLPWPQGIRSGICQGRPVLLVPEELPPDSWQPLLSGFTAGVSDSAAPVHALAAPYKRARETVSAMVALGLSASTRSAEQLGFYRILVSHMGRDELHREFSHALGDLVAEEGRRHVPLTDTLAAFLHNGQRPKQTAASLHVHVNTLYQRLEAIDAILGPGWRTPERALELQLVLHLTKNDQALRKAD